MSAKPSGPLAFFLLWGTLGVCSAGYLLTQSSAETGSSGLALALLGLGGISLELAAPKLPQQGFLSATFLVWLGLTGSYQSSELLVLLTISLILRALLRPDVNASSTARSLLQDFTPQAMALCGGALLATLKPGNLYAQTVAITAIFLPFYLMLLRQSEVEGKDRDWRDLCLDRALPLQVGGGVIIAASAGAPSILVFAIAVFALAQLRTLSSLVETEHRRLLELRLKKGEEQLHRSRETLEELKDVLQLKRRETSLLNSINYRLVGARTRDAALTELSELCRELFKVEGAAFYLHAESEVFKTSQTGGLTFPAQPNNLMKDAFRSGRAQCGRVESHLFELASPVPKIGVLYTLANADFTDRDLELATLLTTRAEEALRSAYEHQSDRDTILQKEQRAKELEQTVAMLDTFIELSLQFGNCGSEEVMLRRASDKICAVVDNPKAELLVGDEVSEWMKSPQYAAIQSRGGPGPHFFDSSGRLVESNQATVLMLRLESSAEGWFRLSGSTDDFKAGLRRRLQLLQILLSQATQNLKSRDQLLQSAKLAAVGTLAAGMAHEINNPLAAISLGIDGAKFALAKRPESALKRLEATAAPLARVRGLLDRLLKSAESGAVDYELVSCDLSEILESIKGELHTLWGSKSDVELQIRAPESLKVSGHPPSLQEIIVNLVSNAGDASLAAGQSAQILVELKQFENQAVLEVTDNGPGVEASLVDSLFEPFFTTKEPGRGTGLGLYVARETAIRHGGSLALAGNEAGRCTFRLSLPLEFTNGTH